MWKVSVFTLVLMGTIVYLPICIAQYFLFYYVNQTFEFYSIVPAPSNANSPVPDLYKHYQDSIVLIKICRTATLVCPIFTACIFVLSFLFFLSRISLSKERYLSIFSFSNPYAIMIALYHRTEYKISIKTFTENKSVCMIIINLYLLGFVLLSLGDIGLQIREMYQYQHGQSNFYDMKFQLMNQIQIDIRNSSNNNCKINPNDSKSAPSTIYSPYCEVTAAQIEKSLLQDRQFYDNYVLSNDFTPQSVIYLIIKLSFGIYSGLSTILSMITVAICGSCVVGFYTRESNTYISHTVYAKRQKVIPIN